MARKKGGASEVTHEAQGAEAEPGSETPPSLEGPKAQAAEQPHEQQARRPAHRVRIGRISASVWENHNPQTGRWFSVVVTRSYQDASSGQWKSASSFGRDDLLVVGEVCRLAFLWINEQYGHEGNGS